MTIAALSSGSEETAPRKTGENTVKHHDGGVGSVVANHHGGGESSVVITTVIVRTHLEYANSVWYPKRKTDKLEWVQKRATKLILEWFNKS